MNRAIASAVALSVCWAPARTSRADDVKPPSAAPKAQTAPVEPLPNSPTAEGPPIAPPQPGAPPEKVQEAKDTASAAGLHPILPSPTNPQKPAFQLYAELDLPLLGIGLVFAGARLVRLQNAYCAPLCDRSPLNWIDRRTAGYWSPTWQTASNVGLYSLMVGAAALLTIDEGPLAALNDGVVVAESALASVAVATVMTLATGRPRPFLYGEKAPLSERNSPNGGLSYLSSHAAVSAAIASSSFMALRRLHPDSKAQWVVLGVGGSVAAFVAVARVMGGMHFITDSLSGAVVGTSLGVLVPAMHRSPVAIVPVVGQNHRGLALAGRF